MRHIAVFALLLISLPAAAQNRPVAARLRECADIADPKARLECFDRLASTIASPAPAPRSSRVNGWSVSSETNPLDDTQTVALTIQADQTGSWVENPVTLILRCQSGVVEAYINWGVYIGNSAAVVTWRAGDGRAAAEQWTVSTDSKSTFCPSNEVAFVEQLLKADRLATRVTPYNSNPITAVFDLTGLSEAIVPFRAACRWR